MGQPFVGEIRMFGGTFAPQGWSFCNGALLSIAQNSTLYQLIGTTYGGDGQTTFGLPDLQGRVPVHQGQSPGTSNYGLGQKGGAETVTLSTSQLPAHSHPAIGSGGSPASNPSNASWGNNALGNSFAPATAVNNLMNAGNIGSNPGGQPHDNVNPFLVISFIISLNGVYPSQ